MQEFIPAYLYYDIYVNSLLVLLLFVYFHCFVLNLDDKRNLLFINISGYILLSALTLFMGLRPISLVFVDMGQYAVDFLNYQHGEPIDTRKDVVFEYFIYYCSKFLSVKGFFFLCLLLYIIPKFWISKYYFGPYWFYAFIAIVGSFSFWTYGVNGIRNGIATSMFLTALCLDKSKAQYVFLALSYLFHSSLILPILAWIMVKFYNNPKIYLLAWLGAIPTSFVLGGFFTSMFAALGFGDDRLASYLAGSSGSFRFDFLFYSSFPVFAGWYFIFKKNFRDKVYTMLFNTYLICNLFWVLIIRANFSNRFAYLSWFLMALVIFYPLLKEKLFDKQRLVLSKVLMLYFLFTYLMYFVYYD